MTVIYDKIIQTQRKQERRKERRKKGRKTWKRREGEKGKEK